eukprot:1803429-Rhodomonas_salina.1
MNHAPNMTIGESANRTRAMSQLYQNATPRPKIPCMELRHRELSFELMPSSICCVHSAILLDSSPGLLVSYQPMSWLRIAFK